MNADTYELKEALLNNAVDLISYALGTAPNKAASSRKEMRWGNKGSFVFNIYGRKRGLWYDFEAQEGGDIFTLVGQRILRTKHFVEICNWCREWLGWPPDGPAPNIFDDDMRRREKAQKQAEKDEKEEQDQKKRINKARSIWDRSVSILGTAAEKYLVQVRKINAANWPDALRFDPTEHALVVAVTTTDNKFVGVQIIRLTKEGRKIAKDGLKRQKLSYGVVASGAVRYSAPHEGGPLLVAEGPETGLSVWCAASYETWVSLGSITKLSLPKNRRIIICRDDDDRHSKARSSLTNQIRQWRQDGFNITEVYPWNSRQYGGLDFNDLMQLDGPSHIRARILLGLREHSDTSNFLSVDEARVKLDNCVSTFFSLAKEGHKVAHAIRVSLGTGKTETAIRQAIHWLNEIRKQFDEKGNQDQRIIVFSVPEHRLSDDIKRRVQSIAEASHLSVEVWRGREATSPDDKRKMCENIDEVRLAQSHLANIGEEVCPECAYFNGCPYLEQQDMEADILIVAHAMLFHEAIALVKKRGLLALIVDESPWAAGLKGVGDQNMTISLDALDSGAMPIPQGDGPMGGARLSDLRSRLKNALVRESDGPVRKEALLKQGFGMQSGKDGKDLEWKRKQGKKDGNWRDRIENRTLLPMIQVWEAVEALMAPDAPQKSGFIELTRNKNKTRILTIRGHATLGSNWNVSTLFIDATLDLELLKPFWPHVELIDDLLADAPYQYIYQTTGRSFGKSLLQPLQTPPKNEKAVEEEKRRSNARRRVVSFINRVDRETGGATLVISNKRIVEELALPPHIHRAHFNAVAGHDKWGDVKAIVIVGRTQPPPKAVEDIAAALTGRAPNALTGWYPGGDVFWKIRGDSGVTTILGEADTHPDEMCERIRSRIAEGEVMQAIGRGRGVNRKEQNPLAVFVLSDVNLPVPIDGILSNDLIFKPTPEDLMLSEGGVAFEDGAAAALAYPSLWKTAEAARTAMHRASSVTFPYKNSSIGDCNDASRLRSVTYQRQGNGQHKAKAKFDSLRITDPRLTLERFLGPLAFFELTLAPDEQGFDYTKLNPQIFREFCLRRLAELYLEAPIPLSRAEAEREMLTAYQLISGTINSEVVSVSFHDIWFDLLDRWDLDIRALADKLWEERNQERAKSRLKLALAIFNAHAELQISCPTGMLKDEWPQAVTDSCHLIKEFATEAIEQGWTVEDLYAKPFNDRIGLVYWLSGEKISEFYADYIITTSGREFLPSHI